MRGRQYLFSLLGFPRGVISLCSMEVMKEIRDRFTPRHFDGRPLTREVTDRILEAGRLAPSAKNRQAWRFISIEEEVKKGLIQERCFGDERVGDAGAVVAACTTNIEYRMPNGQPSYPIDIAVAVSFMMIQAEHEGVATAMLTTYDESAVKELLTVPQAMRVVMLLLLGYTEDKKRPPDRLPATRIISYNHW